MGNELLYTNMIEDTLRNIRHDYLNEIQIIYGYIRLNKVDKAIDYIESIKQESIVNSKLSRLSCIFFYIAVFNSFKKAKSLNLDIDFEVFSTLDKEDFITKDLFKEICMFEQSFNEVLEYMYNNSYFEKHIIYIEETKDVFSFKIDISNFDKENILNKFKGNDFIIEENNMTYEVELKGD